MGSTTSVDVVRQVEEYPAESGTDGVRTVYQCGAGNAQTRCTAVAKYKVVTDPTRGPSVPADGGLRPPRSLDNACL